MSCQHSFWTGTSSSESQNTNTTQSSYSTTTSDTTTSMSEWDTLRELIIDWLENHPDLQMDKLFATWLDPSQQLYRDYKVS